MSELKDDSVQRLVVADAVLAELAHVACPEELAELHAAVAAGDAEALDRLFIQREMHVLPGANPRKFSNYRPTYSIGRFPQQPRERTPGGAMLTGRQIRDRVAERVEIFDRYGEAAKDASPGLREPVI